MNWDRAGGFLVGVAFCICASYVARRCGVTKLQEYSFYSLVLIVIAVLIMVL